MYEFKKLKPQLVLRKNGHSFIFPYEIGKEEIVLDAAITLANDPNSDFDWFDAAVLSFKLTQHLLNKDVIKVPEGAVGFLIACRCGKLVPYNHYRFVNVITHPDLYEKVWKREINTYHCLSCGFHEELVEPFWYSDPRLNIEIFVSPKDVTILGEKPGISLEEYSHHLELFEDVVEIVYGYDELVEKLRQYYAKQ
jgi:hypothetical protein